MVGAELEGSQPGLGGLRNPPEQLAPWLKGGKAGACRKTSASSKTASSQRHRPCHKDIDPATKLL